MTDEQLKAKAREIAVGIAPGTVKRAHQAAYLGLLEGRRMMKEEAAAKLQVLLLGLPTNGLKAEGISEAAAAIRSIL